MVIIPAITRYLGAACVSVALFSTASAATYYIDFADGSDGNSGTSKSSPWQRCPGMNGFNHSYIHTPGDRFIFKGGVTWTGVFTWPMNNGGTAAAPDYYGTDNSWFAGSSFRRPVFDFQYTAVNGGAGISVKGAFNTIDNFEFTRWIGLGYYGAAQIYVNTGNTSGNGGVLISNCLFHDWKSPTDSVDKADSAVLAYNSASEVSRCEFHQAGITQKSGVCTYNVGYINFCNFHDTTNAVLGGGVIHDNVMHDMPAPSDPNTHGNAIEVFSPSTIYNNLIYNLEGHIAPILMYPADAPPDGWTSSSYCYNNVIYNVSQGSGFATENGKNPRNMTVYLFNNTVAGPGIGVDGTNGGTAPSFRYLMAYVQNNHCISNTGTPIKVAGVTNTPVFDHNLVQSPSEASASGYTAANAYKPSSGSAPTVNGGATISMFSYDRLNAGRPQGGIWDIGAYEFGGVPGATPVPTATPGPSSTPSGTATPAPTATPRPSATPVPTAAPTATPPSTPTPPPSVSGLTFDATDGVITFPFVATSAGISQPVQTTDPALGGRAVYTITIPSTGDYGIAADVICGGDANNSFFLNFDAEPTAPQMIWDVNATNGVQQRIVSWRGAGTDTTNEFSPKIFHLSQGIHQLIIRGRESSAEIDRISLVKAPAPPTNLAVQQ